MIIDFTTRETITPELTQALNPGAAPPLDTRYIEMTREAYDACKHQKMQIDQKQATVKCGSCGIWLNPVWCLGELFAYYESRVDLRVKAIEQWEARQKELRERKEARRRRPRALLLQRREESLERAAYNEYQAKLLLIRADKQRCYASKLDLELVEPLSLEGRT